MLGVPKDFAQHTVIYTYNDLSLVRKNLEDYLKEVAAIIVEPVSENMHYILPSENFLPGFRQLCNEFKGLLIMDEVMTGFLVALRGAQEYYNIKPDLTFLGKIIVHGLPGAAFGYCKEVISILAPLDPVYQS